MDPALRELLLRGAGSDDVEAIIRFDDEACTAPAGVAIVAKFGTIATCRLTRRDVPRVREAPGVASLKAPRLLGPDIATMAAGPSALMPADARRPEGIVETGRGVVLGVLDWGLDIAAAAFRHANGATRVLALWDQRTRRGARQRNVYGYGWIHSQRAIDAALRTPNPYAALRYDPADSDPGGVGAHGTVVTELAAGNGRSGGLQGVAPQCEIVFVHLASRDTTGLANLGDSIGILEGVDFVRRVAAGRPMVCSMSVGRHAGPHDGSTLVELGLDAFLAGGPNRAIAQSAGNYARRRCHASGPLVPGYERALSLIIDASDVTQNEVEVWHDCAACAVDLELPDGTRSGWTRLGEVTDVTRGDRVVARLYHRRSDPQNGSHHVDAFIAAGAPGGAWTMRLRDERTSGAPTTFHAWIERDDACPTCQSRFGAGDDDPSCTLGTLATGRGPIVCGAFDAHDAARDLGAFSSDGPTRDGRPKPDIAAPGVGVLSLQSRPRGHAPGANAFTRRTGTSMAAPQVAGCAALILEAGRGLLDGAEVRDLVLASTDPASSRAPRRSRHSPGYLDIARALETTRRYVTAPPSKQRKDVRTMDATPNLRHLERALDDPWPPQPHSRDLSALMVESRRALDQRYHRLASHAADAADADVEVIARAGDMVVHTLQPGDGLLRIARGEPGLGHIAVLVDGRLMSRDEAIASGFTCEGGPAGLYAWIVDAGARPHRADDRFARLVVSRSGAVPAGQMIVRPRTAGADLAQASAEGTLLWSDDAGFDEGAMRDPIAGLPLVGDDEGADGDRVDPGDEGTSPFDMGGDPIDVPGDAPYESDSGWTVLPADGDGDGDGWVNADGVEAGGWTAASWDAVPASPPAPTTLAMRSPSATRPRPVRARILWPALGFPAVITPPATPGVSPFEHGDATRCVCVLVLSDTEQLSKAEAARYLRAVPWAERGRRHIEAGQPGSFREEDLAVRNGGRQGLLTDPRPKDRLGELVRFGADGNDRRGIVASLGKKVKEVYAREGLVYLHEIRLYDRAIARLPLDLYHLFWNNEVAGEHLPSDEMTMLLRAHAQPERSKLGALWQAEREHLLKEYAVEYGGMHLPYKAEGAKERPAEILHPLFIWRRPSAQLRIGQVSDTHVDVRNDVYEANLRRSPNPAMASLPFNNWNTDFVDLYRAARADADVVMLTGDLIDYGRGHWGVSRRKELGDDRRYQSDRNWFLFSYLLSRDNEYTRPTYTILGNHDWRLNPYPPMAIAGAPKAPAFVHGMQSVDDARAKAILTEAHGPGASASVSYNPDVERRYSIALRNAGRLLGHAVRKMFGGESTMDVPGLPTETTVESVAWYLLAINPFLDYRFSLPGSHGVLMLDWAEDESVFLGDIYQGKRYGSFDKHSGDEGPKARNALTDLQMALVREFAEAPGVAKVIGIHAPPIGPWDDWNDQELASSWRTFKIGGRGYPHYARVMADGRKEKGHPLFAIKPKKGVVPDAVEGMDASYNSFERRRDEFIRTVVNPKHGVRLVLSGHIHRQGLYVVYRAPDALGEIVAGELLVKGVTERDTRGVKHPAASLATLRNAAQPLGVAPGALFVNATSAGPRGNMLPAEGVYRRRDPGWAHITLSSDGTIVGVQFRQRAPVATGARTA